MPLLNTKVQIVFFFILLSAALLFRSEIEKTHYCTPDSKYYLEVSDNILKGLGPVGPPVFGYDSSAKAVVTFRQKTQFGNPDTYDKQYFAIWPLGYPLAIVAVASVTNLSPLWASKVLNILLLAVSFYLLWILLDSHALLSVFYFGSYTMLEICSYTWSENLYLPLFLLFLLSIKKIHKSNSFSVRWIFLFTLSLSGMCLARYASAVYFIVGGIILLYYFYKSEKSKSIAIALGLFFSSLIFISYLYINYLKTGYITGMQRTDIQELSFWQLVQLFWLGMFNQLHIIKQFRFNGNADFILYLLLTIIQIAVIFFIIYQLRKKQYQLRFDTLARLLLLNSSVYLVFITYLTFNSTIDPFDYRTLLPFTFPLIIALLFTLEKELRKKHQMMLMLIIQGFFLFSLIMNLPKHYLLSLL